MVRNNSGFSRWGPRVKLESREGGAITIFGRTDDESSNDGILMDIIPMMNEVLNIANSMIRESALPDFGFSSDESSEFMRVRALD